MKKIILTTALTGLCTSAFAQNYTYEYEYQYQPYEFQQQQIQEEALQPSAYQNPYTQSPNVAGVQERNWNASVGMLLATTPEYLGADKNEFKIVPVAVGEYKLDPWQKVFLALGPGSGGEYGGAAGYEYSLSENLDLGLGMGFRQGRESKDARILSGLEDIDDTLTYMAFAKYNYYDFNFKAKVSKGMKSSNDGFTTKLSAGYKHIASPKLVLTAGLSTTFADSDYMKQNFSTTENSSVGRTAFKADAGFRDVSLSLGANYKITGPHNIVAGTKFTKLIGDAKKSPVSKDDLNITAAAGYRYKF